MVSGKGVARELLLQLLMKKTDSELSEESSTVDPRGARWPGPFGVANRRLTDKGLVFEENRTVFSEFSENAGL